MRRDFLPPFLKGGVKTLRKSETLQGGFDKPQAAIYKNTTVLFSTLTAEVLWIVYSKSLVGRLLMRRDFLPPFFKRGKEDTLKIGNTARGIFKPSLVFRTGNVPSPLTTKVKNTNKDVKLLYSGF